MRREKINQILELLKGDPRNKPRLIIYWPTNKYGNQYETDEYECMLQYDNRPNVTVTVAEGREIQQLYPDVLAFKVVYKSTVPSR